MCVCVCVCVCVCMFGGGGGEVVPTHVVVSRLVDSRKPSNSQSTIPHHTSVAKVIDVWSNPTAIAPATITPIPHKGVMQRSHYSQYTVKD